MITNKYIRDYYRHRAEEYAKRFSKKQTKIEMELYCGLAKIIILSTVRSIRFLAKRGFEKHVI